MPLVLMLMTVFYAAYLSHGAHAERVRFSVALSPDEIHCFRRLFQASHWNILPQWESDMLSAAKVGRVDLNGDRHNEYVYLMEGNGWCGSAGCKLLIGEKDRSGDCRLLFDGDGFRNFEVLQRRDHGYRRLFSPCEVHFDGRQYRQIRSECPAAGVER